MEGISRTGRGRGAVVGAQKLFGMYNEYRPPWRPQQHICAGLLTVPEEVKKMKASTRTSRTGRSVHRQRRQRGRFR